MIEHEVNVRINYADTDQMGFVYYGNYPRLFEIGRVELFRYLNYSYKFIEESNIIMPVSELKVKYLKPIFYDDMVSIKTSLIEYPTKPKITFYHKIYNTNKELTTKGEVTLFILNSNNKRPCSLPEEVLEKVKQYF